MERTARHRSVPWKRLLATMALVAAMLVGVLGGGPRAFAQDDPGFAIGDAVVVDTAALNLRAEPGLDAEILAVLIDGTEGVVVDGPVTSDDLVWYQLEIADTTGWSAAEYLQLATSEHGLIPVGSIVAATVDDLNFRADPTTDAEVLATLAEGTSAVVISGPTSADGYDWYEIYLDGDAGWVVRDYIAFMLGDVTELAIGDFAVVNTDTLNLRDDATVNGEVVAVLVGGTEVEILDGPVEADGWTWFQVETADGAGWLAGEFLIT